MSASSAPPLADLWPRRLWFARHGRTAMNLTGLVQGSLDPPLDPLGDADACRLAERLRGAGVARVLTSGQRRARQTGAAVAGALGLPLAADPRLNERAWGPWEGRPRDLRPSLPDPPGAEPAAALAARVAAALADACAAGAAEDLLVVAHAGVFRALTGLLALPDAGPLSHAEPVLLARVAGRIRAEALHPAPP